MDELLELLTNLIEQMRAQNELLEQVVSMLLTQVVASEEPEEPEEPLTL